VAKQRTIKDPVEIEGVGLQTGAKVKLSLKGSPAGSGINFIRVDLPNKPLLNIQSFNFDESVSRERRTVLGIGPLEIQTTEHFLAALAGLGIDNIIAEADNAELPGLDGSAAGFLAALKKAKVIEQESSKREIALDSPVWCADKDAFLAVFPGDGFRVSYTMSYPHPALGTQFLSLTVDEAAFEGQIAPARTFCLEEEALELLKRGLGKGADYDNTLVMGKGGPIKNALRFPDEPVRHKILDLIGDLCLAGAPLKGHVVAIKSGHRLNMEMVKKLKKIVKG